MSDQRQLSQRYQYNVKGEFMKLWKSAKGKCFNLLSDSLN